MSIFEPRVTYKPFHYPQAYQFFMTQTQAHWVHTEVPMISDVKDFREKLTADEKQVIIRILRLFTQTEITVGEYWTAHIARWFPHPEIQQMALTFGAMEMIHVSAYNHLNETLGLPESEYLEFLKEPSMMDRQNSLNNVNSLAEKGGKVEKLIALAVFSAFTEGTNLFSSFSTLLNFSRRGLMKGVADIINYSIRDESLHSQAGTWLFRTAIAENPELWTKETKQKIYQAARDSIDLEDAYIDYVFKDVQVEGITVNQLKAFIRHRANVKLGDLGLKMNWKTLDKVEVRELTQWFDVISAGRATSDFFSRTVSEYSKNMIDFNNVNFKEDLYT